VRSNEKRKEEEKKRRREGEKERRSRPIQIIEEGGSRPSAGPASLFGAALLGSIFSIVRRGSKGGEREGKEK